MALSPEEGSTCVAPGQIYTFHEDLVDREPETGPHFAVRDDHKLAISAMSFSAKVSDMLRPMPQHVITEERLGRHRWQIKSCMLVDVPGTAKHFLQSRPWPACRRCVWNELAQLVAEDLVSSCDHHAAGRRQIVSKGVNAQITIMPIRIQRLLHDNVRAWDNIIGADALLRAKHGLVEGDHFYASFTLGRHANPTDLERLVTETCFRGRHQE
mmetsp:Transcript_15605/g.40214  ORF Transcript_15605/g.40214 Transcript_15605/m.40214 type:complete len:212 (-) Transcript_15605:228-863(-)